MYLRCKFFFFLHFVYCKENMILLKEYFEDIFFIEHGGGNSTMELRPACLNESRIIMLIAYMNCG